MFHMEYKVASCVVPVLKKHTLESTISETMRVGYITLHVHSAIDDDKVSDAMQDSARGAVNVSEIVEECHGQNGSMS